MKFLFVLGLLMASLALQAQVFYTPTFSGVVIQSSTNVDGPYLPAFTLPDATLIEGPMADTPGVTFYFRFRLNQAVTHPNPTNTVISTSLTYQDSLSDINGPYNDHATVHITTITNPGVNTFYRAGFELTDTNFVYIDPITVGWVTPY